MVVVNPDQIDAGEQRLQSAREQPVDGVVGALLLASIAKTIQKVM